MDIDIQLYPDESLESCLLRLSQFKGYERYSYFAQDIWYEMLNSYEATPGAFPLQLNRVNIYRAQTTSQMRARVLTYLEKQLQLNSVGLLCLVLNRSNSKFSPDYKAVHRFGIDYPFAFLRKRFTPVCPRCLSEVPYIRQNWHFVPIQVCEKHQCKLIHRCLSANRCSNIKIPRASHSVSVVLTCEKVMLKLDQTLSCLLRNG
ncbi:hypothetical protein JCM19239_2679 [Vibrio variabilis]|uniref:TniQ domain-containing protein n=1 Tax=Vibrio variabilis TaxID=990271 RepID=A0ABQ0JNL4_9VIBR|nr:hypothetical protein JCM19239_2679 [Vibrio variabilis]